uniref:G domain-containing protein n=1 Tax=Acrobeloides nanus TaxID=290746 RepID=A0A914EDD5_9BILA
MGACMSNMELCMSPLDKKLAKEEISIFVERNEIIEKVLHEEKIKNKRIVKVLLLGAPESGKSTLFKQMK